MPRSAGPSAPSLPFPSRRSFLAQSAAGLGLAAALPALAFESRETAPRGIARIDGERLTLGNERISAEWEVRETGLRLARLTDVVKRRVLTVGLPAFSVTVGNSVVDSTRLKLQGAPKVEELTGDPRASRLSERLAGKQLVARLREETSGLALTWRAVLREGSSYLRHEVTLEAGDKDVPVTEACLVDLRIAGGTLIGSVKGSPVVAGTFYFGVEHPLSTSWAGSERIRCALARALPLRAKQSFTVSAVFGVTPEGQLRRGFLSYVERERAHPYRTFLHYNSWYDIGYFSKFDEAAALGVVQAFGEELAKKRGVPLDSFLFDDGWDDRKLWGFHDGFPKGFAPLKEATARFGSAPGVWLSPWGGYGPPKKERLSYAATQGFEVQDGGLALSGPVYYKRFREVCLEMIRSYGVNQLKLDGTGNAAQVVPGSAFGSDFDAALALIGDLRKEKQDLYVNLTTGTYASPFWLRWADSIWRGGEDHDFTGVGTDRQRWITYRDADTYQGVVLSGPLFPVNALMLHGLIYARHAKKLNVDPAGDFDAEIRSYFGTGTQLQEMYVTPSLLTPGQWDRLAEAARWARRNADILVDSRWVGGDPARLEPYGWASWSPRGGILTLRNPSDREQTFEVDPAAAFELPPGSAETWVAKSPWKEGGEPSTWRAGRASAVKLGPFEVKTVEVVARVG